MESKEDLRKLIKSLISNELLDALDTVFPEKSPELSDSLDHIRYASGQRSVIRFLRGL